MFLYHVVGDYGCGEGNKRECGDISAGEVVDKWFGCESRSKRIGNEEEKGREEV